jgi:predicted RNA binding protein YcfA (HicA-like mRNA interferase family)
LTGSPASTGHAVVAALRRLGFEVTRARGSHSFLRHPDGRATVVPVHRGEDLGRGLLAKILRDAKLTEAELREVL